MSKHNKHFNRVVPPFGFAPGEPLDKRNSVKKKKKTPARINRVKFVVYTVTGPKASETDRTTTYVGVSGNVYKRWYGPHGHILGFFKALHSGQTAKFSKLQRAYETLGIQNCTFAVHSEFKTLEEALTAEIDLIALWDTYRNGLNSSPGGEHPRKKNVIRRSE